MTWSRTGYTPGADRSLLNTVTKAGFLQKRGPNKLADILIVESTEVSEKRIIQYKEKNKIILYHFAVDNFIRQNFPEALL